MRRQVIVTDWKNGQPPRVVYVDEGASSAKSRDGSTLDVTKEPHARRLGESGGRVLPKRGAS